MSETNNTKETFLTSRLDRELTPQEFRKQMVENAGVPPLTNDETLKAMNDLCVGNPVPDYPGVDRLYADPPIPGQRFGLFSFIPAKGATPDADGIYGMAKIRGCYDNPMEIEQREEFIIRNVDSYHKIQRPYVGRPFPITIDSRFSAEKKEIDIRKKTTEIISGDIKTQKRDEQSEIRDIEERAERLKEDTSKDLDDVEPMELYTTLKVKLAQLTWTYQEHQKKIQEVKDIIIKTRKEIKELDDESDEYAKNVYEKYMKAREDSGIPREDNSFISYLCKDIKLDFDEEVQQEEAQEEEQQEHKQETGSDSSSDENVTLTPVIPKFSEDDEE